MFAVTVLTFPEAGLVIYMSIQYWVCFSFYAIPSLHIHKVNNFLLQRIQTMYGMTELACWLARILANVVGLLIVHSLYALWKEESLVEKRLRDLSMAAVTIPTDPSLTSLGSHYYQNNAFESSLEHLNRIKRLHFVVISIFVLSNSKVILERAPCLFYGMVPCPIIWRNTLTMGINFVRHKASSTRAFSYPNIRPMKCVMTIKVGIQIIIA